MLGWPYLLALHLEDTFGDFTEVKRWLVTACADNRDRRGVLRVYALPSLELRKEVKAPNKGFRQVAFNGDGTAAEACEV